MGSREGFITSTNPKITAEKLGKYLAKNKDFHAEYAPIWIVCKSTAVNDLHINSTEIQGEKVETSPICLKAGHEVLCIGWESFTDILHYFPYHIRKSLLLLEHWMFSDENYTDVWKDSPIEVNGKTYFAELIE